MLVVEDKIMVDPELLVTRNAELQKKVNSLSGQFERLNSLMQNTEKYWLGEAGTYHRKMYSDSIEVQEMLLKELKENVRDIEQIAENYKTTEMKLVQETESLPGDIIS